MPEPTPGPWRVGPQGTTIVADHPVPDIVGTDDPFYGGHLIAETVARRNAPLLAAAPELYAALKWFVDDLSAVRSNMRDFDRNVIRARAALKAATSN